jgi:hypothetical protein
MNELPDLPAIRYLKTLIQWVCWIRATRNGKITKIPMCPHNALAASVTNPSHWGTYAQAIACAKKRGYDGVGFVVTEHDNITGVDLDHCRDLKTGAFAPWVVEVLACGETYAEISPSGTGVRMLCLGKIDKTVKADKAGVELYRSGRFLTITGNHIRATPAEIGDAPKTLALLMARVCANRAPSVSAHVNGTDYFRQINDQALARLDVWVPALFPQAKYQPGTGAYRVSSLSLGRALQEDLSLAPSGIQDFGLGQGQTAIDVVMAHGSAPDAKSAARWLCAQMGWQPIEDGRGAALVREILGIPKSDPAKPHLGLDKLMPDLDWTQPAGLIGDMAAWILASSRRPNRPLAVAASTSVVSAVCGRHLYGPTGTALNLYIVALAGTGVGKDRPLSAPSEILRAAGLERLHTTAKGFSVSAVEKMVHDYPCCVATVDEIGGNLLGRMAHKHANTHEASMRTTLMELWSREQGKAAFIGTRRATSDPLIVPSPSLTLFGVSTPEAFYNAVTSGSVADGFLNRFLLCAAAPRAKAREFGSYDRKAPAELIVALHALVPRLEGNLSTLGIYGIAHEPAGVRLAWDNDVVRREADTFEEQILAIIDTSGEVGPLLSRVFETTIRLASLHAVSRGGLRATVGVADLAWGKAWALGSAQRMIDGTQNLMARNEYEEKFNLVRNVIREAGTITRSALLRTVRSINARERDDIIEHLVEGGWAGEVQTGGKGRTAVGWKWCGDEG